MQKNCNHIHIFNWKRLRSYLLTLKLSIGYKILQKQPSHLLVQLVILTQCGQGRFKIWILTWQQSHKIVFFFINFLLNKIPRSPKCPKHQQTNSKKCPKNHGSLKGPWFSDNLSAHWPHLSLEGKNKYRLDIKSSVCPARRQWV